MNLSFHKYQGAGNDFVVIDNRQNEVKLNTEQIAFLCHRRFGIGADGLMLLEQDNDTDFKMVYFNADGRESSMCGNGGRCIAAFAKYLKIVGDSMVFTATDGLHQAMINQDASVSLHMTDVQKMVHEKNFTFLDTGSPHVVKWVENLEHFNVFLEGKKIRNSEPFSPGGTNVNFIEKKGSSILIRTFERGVEDETLACGTGVTAAAIVSVGSDLGNFNIPVKALGGDLSVTFNKIDNQTVKDIVLTGGAQRVFSGSINI